MRGPTRSLRGTITRATLPCRPTLRRGISLPACCPSHTTWTVPNPTALTGRLARLSEASPRNRSILGGHGSPSFPKTNSPGPRPSTTPPTGSCLITCPDSFAAWPRRLPGGYRVPMLKPRQSKHISVLITPTPLPARATGQRRRGVTRLTGSWPKPGRVHAVSSVALSC